MYYYFVDRDIFIKIISNLIDNIENFYDTIEYGYEGDKFKAWYYNEEVYIMDKTNFIIINWYKLTHIGRYLTCNCNMTVKETYKFIRSFRNEALK
jgi:hypothetical protein|nr:MAG TPA: hypothetical protein [Caudoviricetes sp.]